MEGLARPVRIAAKSSRVTSTAFFILLSASLRVWLITAAPRVCVSFGSTAGSGVPGDRRADLLTRDDPCDVPVLGEVEHDHRHVVVAAEADRRAVGDLQAAGQELVVGQ